MKSNFAIVNYKNFNAIVCTGDMSAENKGFICYRKQTSLERLKSYLNTKYKDWRFMTIYDRRTNEKEVIKRN